MEKVQKLKRYLDALESANSIMILFALNKLGKARAKQIQIEIVKRISHVVSLGSIQLRLNKLIEQGFVKREGNHFKLSKEGKKLAKIADQLLNIIEKELTQPKPEE